MRLVLSTAVLFGQSVLAHYKWPALILDDVATPDYEYVRLNTNNINPIMDINSTDMRCNQGGLDSGPQTSTATIVAGDTVRLQHRTLRIVLRRLLIPSH
jgi:hypothetical protein